jgi:succinoglycan biosynthesis protein ExoV
LDLYYYKDPAGNFGDDLNPWLWPQLFPKPIAQCFDDDTLFLGIGTILNHKVPAQPRKKVVFGSGLGYGALPSVNKHWRLFCVRGPLTAQALGFPPELAISDSALLLREIVEPAPQARTGVAFMPHHRTAEHHDWRSICEAISMRYIDPCAPVEQTLEAIRHSTLVITEAMHGAIVADALRVPWIPVRTRPAISNFKWQDWSCSLHIEHQFEWLPPIWNPKIDSRFKRILHPVASTAARHRLQWLARHGQRRLSHEGHFMQVYSRMLNAFHRLIEEAVGLN